MYVGEEGCPEGREGAFRGKDHVYSREAYVLQKSYAYCSMKYVFGKGLCLREGHVMLCCGGHMCPTGRRINVGDTCYLEEAFVLRRVIKYVLV